MDMSAKQSFNTEERVNRWTEDLKALPSLTEADREELKSHLMETIENLYEVLKKNKKSYERPPHLPQVNEEGRSFEDLSDS